MFSARGARDRSRLRAIASRSGALASYSACMMAFENSITRLTPREVRTSTISYCSGDSSRCRLAKAGVYSYSYARSFCSAYSISAFWFVNSRYGIDGHRPQSSSASRFTAGAAGFLLLIQSGERPER